MAFDIEFGAIFGEPPNRALGKIVGNTIGKIAGRIDDKLAGKIYGKLAGLVPRKILSFDFVRLARANGGGFRDNG